MMPVTRPARGLLAAALVAGVTVGALPLRAVAATPGLPGYSHVVVLVLENESYASTFGPSSAAHFLNSALLPQGTLDDQYFGTGHASLDNYVAMTSGQPANPLTSGDCLAPNLYTCAQSLTVMAGGRNIGDQLEAAHLSWTGYMDSMPKPCFHADYSPTAQPDPYQGDSRSPPATDYADRHNPFVYYPDIVGDDTRCAAHVLPYTKLAADIGQNTVPAFSFITPDTCHDGHDSTCSNGRPGGLTSADLWLSAEMPRLLDYLASHNGLLLLTFDEGNVSDPGGCCHGGPDGAKGFGGQVGLLAVGPGVAAGRTIHTAYDHASLLRTVEDLFGISEHLNNAASSTPMTDLFAGPSAAAPEVPLAALLPLAGAGLALVVAWRRRRRAVLAAADR